MVGIPSLDTNPSRNANIDEPAATTTGPLVGASVVAAAPILTANCVALTFFVTTKLPSNGSPLNVVIPVLILILELTLNQWLLADVRVAIPLLVSYERLVILKLSPVT